VYKIAWLVKLAGTEDRDERSRRWSEDHGALMRAVPGLERHTVNQGPSIAEGPGAGRDAPAVDGVAYAAAGTSSIVVPRRPCASNSSLKSCGLVAASRALSNETRPAATWAYSAWSKVCIPS
jgi:hypothetical protein